MSAARILAMIAVMAIITYLPRVIPITVFRKRIRNRFVQSFLLYMPYGVLGAMVFPQVLYATASLASEMCIRDRFTAVRQQQRPRCDEAHRDDIGPKVKARDFPNEEIDTHGNERQGGPYGPGQAPKVRPPQRGHKRATLGGVGRDIGSPLRRLAIHGIGRALGRLG